MPEYYLEIRILHIIAVCLSGAIFFVRGVGLICGRTWPRSIWVRYPVYIVDCTLLIAALILMSIIQQNPFSHSWLGLKISLLAFYIWLGIQAFRQHQSRPHRIAFWCSALLIYLYIISIAIAHHPLGAFRLSGLS